MTDPAPPVTSWSGTLVPLELEHEYRVWDWPAAMRRTRIAIITASAVFFLFLYSDVLHFGLAWPLPVLVALRVSVALGGLAIWLALRGPPRPRRLDRLLLIWTAWAGLLAAVILPATRPAAWILHGFIVCTSIPAVYLLIPVTFLGGLVVGVGMAVGYLTFVLVTNAELSYMQGAVVTISLAASNLFGAVASRTLHLTQRAGFIQQRALERARREADAASHAKSDLLATVSHEIRTPLHGVLGAVQLLERAELGAAERDHVAIIRRSAGGMLELVDGILDFARTDAGADAPRPIVFDPRALVKEVVDHVASRVGAARLVVTIATTIPERVRGDAGRLRRALLNLVDNAIKYGDDTPIGVDVRALDASGDAVRVRITVDNGGPPIPEGARATLFEPFVQRAQPDLARRGFGLGLAIARRDLEALGGTVALEASGQPGDAGPSGIEASPAGRTVFALELPLDIVKYIDESPVAPPPLAVTERRPLAILIVEDDPVSARLATTFLAVSGHRTRLATSGPEAVAVAAAEAFDAILMDVRLPGFDGVEATRRILAAGHARVPIIATTANAMPEDRARYLAAGVSAVVSKPIDFDALEALLAHSASPPPDLSRARGTDAPAPLVDEALIARLSAVLGRAAVADLIALAMTTGARLVEAIIHGAARADADEVTRAAHRLASAAHSAALTRLGDVAGAVELGRAAVEDLRATWDGTLSALAARQAGSSASR